MAVLKGPSLSSKGGWHIFCHIQVGHKTTPVNTLLYWGCSKSYFKTPFFFSRAQKNFYGGMHAFFRFYFFKHSPGRLAPGVSWAMGFHCNFGEVTKSNRLCFACNDSIPVDCNGYTISTSTTLSSQYSLKNMKNLFSSSFSFHCRFKPSCISFSFFYTSPISPVVSLSLWQTSWMLGCWMAYTAEPILPWCTPTGRAFPVKDGQRRGLKSSRMRKLHHAGFPLLRQVA